MLLQGLRPPHWFGELALHLTAVPECPCIQASSVFRQVTPSPLPKIVSSRVGEDCAMPPRFVADSMLGRLAKWLRAFGFDVFYDALLDDRGVVACARERGAIALTRDTGFPKPKDVRIILVNSDHIAEQLAYVVEQVPLDLAQARPLTRCTMCNDMLVPATRDDVWDRIPPFIYLTNETYARCPGCSRVYWEGSHAPRIRAEMERLYRSASGRSPA